MSNHEIDRLQALAETELIRVGQVQQFDSMLSHIVELATDLMPASMGASVILWDPASEKFSLSATTVPGLSADTFTKRTRNEGGVTRWIVEQKEPFIVEDVSRDPFRKNRKMQDHGVRAYIGQPLCDDQSARGVLFLFDDHIKSYSSEDIAFSSLLANRISAAIKNVQTLDTIHNRAMYDQLTQVYNRHMLFEIGAIEFARYKRYGHPLSLTFLDLDDFKLINDQFGHVIGDEVLRNVAGCILSATRETDSVFRFGGDEFILLSPETNQASARKILERIQKCLGTIRIGEADEAQNITLSLGSIEASDEMRSFDDLLTAANTSMHHSKRSENSA